MMAMQQQHAATSMRTPICLSMQACAATSCRHHQGSGPCERMRLADFLAWWRRHHQQQQQQQQVDGASSPAAEEVEERLWYCKVSCTAWEE